MKNQNTKKVNFDIASLCPCGEEKPVILCCGSLINGRFWKKPPNLVPPLPATGYSHPKCYLWQSGNCSTELSAEHLMSRAILEQISIKGAGGGAVVNVGGLPWVPAGGTIDVGVSSLTAKVLCRRHNSALGPLDDTVARFFSRLKSGILHSRVRTLSRKRSVTLTSGEAFEKWMLKVVCGMFYSKYACRDGCALVESQNIDEDIICSLLSSDLNLVEPCGLYMKWVRDSSFRVEEAISMAPLSHIPGDRLVGLHIRFFGGLEFQLIFDPRGIDAEQITTGGWIYRPSEIAISTDRRVDGHHISWPEGTRKIAIGLTRTPTKSKRIE